jgi:hypothetical protein
MDGGTVEPRTDLMRGTLDLLILRSLTAMPLHGLGIARRIAQVTQGSERIDTRYQVVEHDDSGFQLLLCTRRFA